MRWLRLFRYDYGVVFICLKIAWHETNNMPTSSATSLIVIWRLFKIIFFTALMFSLVVVLLEQDIFSAFLKPVIPQSNSFSAHSRLAKRYSQHFKCNCIFNFIFTQNLSCLNPFFRKVKNRRARQNMTNLFIRQKQTDNRKWLILSTYQTTTLFCSQTTSHKADWILTDCRLLCLAHL